MDQAVITGQHLEILDLELSPSMGWDLELSFIGRTEYILCVGKGAKDGKCQRYLLPTLCPCVSLCFPAP